MKEKGRERRGKGGKGEGGEGGNGGMGVDPTKFGRKSTPMVPSHVSAGSLVCNCMPFHRLRLRSGLG